MASSSNRASIVPLGAVARAISQIFRQPKEQITGVETAQMFGPLQPFRPLGGEGAQPWVSQIQPGQNLVYTPRAREHLGAKQLRDASMYDLARIIIENVEDQVSRLPLNVRLNRLPGETGKEYAKRKPDIGKIRAIDQFLERPCAEQHRSQFIRQAVDDMLVIDAASVLVRRNAKGGVYDFRAIDGAQIARYFDAWGDTPQPPNPAYAQIWDAGMSGGVGIPWVDLTTDQLIYGMRNLKTYRLYGMSPLEQAVTIIGTGSARMEFQQAYYTSGSIPDAMQIVPTGVSSDKLKEAQDVLNAELSGILSKRRQIRLVQGFHEDASKEQILFPKEELLKDEFDDYVIRVLCYCFGTSPQRLQRVMGMRSGQVNQNSAEKEGLEPWLEWAENCIWNPMVQRYLAFPDYEVSYEEDTDVDPHVQAQIDDLSVKNGTKPINQVREERGDEPYQNVPEADQPMIITATGPVPLSLKAQVEHATNMAAAMPKPEPAPGGGKGKQSQKIAKRKRATIDPGHETPARAHARAHLERALSAVFMRQKEKAGLEAGRLLKVRKAQDDKKISDDIYAAIEAEFASLPAAARKSLEEAALSGAHDAWLQIEITDEGMISSVNEIAAEYAEKRAAEMVGMKYVDGELVANPNAKWAISDTTRDRIREIVKNGLADDKPAMQLVEDIQDADVFSEERATMIARTEVSRAQVMSNVQAWYGSGIVKGVKWLAVGPDPCPECEDNDGEIRKIGQEFPSGDKYPLVHPSCACILEAVLYD